MIVAGQCNPCVHVRACTYHGAADSNDERTASEEEKETWTNNCGELYISYLHCSRLAVKLGVCLCVCVCVWNCGCQLFYAVQKVEPSMTFK